MNRAVAQPISMAWTLARTDFKSRYQPTVGGFLWALMKPLAMFVVLSAVFSFIFGGTPDYGLNLVIGLFLWDFFAEGTKTGLISLHVKGYLVTKAKFPTWILVVASISNALITVLIFSGVVLAYLATSGHELTATGVALFFTYLALFTLMIVGFSLAGSVLFPRYRDLNQVWEVISQAGFFIAPIVYPLSVVPEKYHLVLYAWPPTPVIQFSRAVLIEGTPASGLAHALLLGETLGILLIGVMLFRQFGPSVAEYV